jgi:hypothetical protein
MTKITQYDAQMVADWYNGSNLIHSSVATNKKIKKLFEQSEKLRLKAHKIIVDDNYWKFFKGKNQRQLKIIYNDNK